MSMVIMRLFYLIYFAGMLLLMYHWFSLLIFNKEARSNKVMFIREAKKFIDSRKEKYLYNIVDKRNTVHLDLLRWLGFKFIREITYGPNNLSFIEFIRPCAHPLQSESPQQLPES